MQALTMNECPPLATSQQTYRDRLFHERYPELSFHFRHDISAYRRIEAHYQRVLDFAKNHVAPFALDFESRLQHDPHYVPEDLLKKACEYRLFSMMFPSLIGGGGEHVIAAIISYEIIASYCVGIANLLGVSGLAIGCVLATFDPRAIAYIAHLITQNEKKGIPTFLSTCVTEPGAGSDAEDADEFAHAQLYTTAKRVEGGYLLNGNKVFISNGSLAALHIVTAYNADGKHRPEDLMVLLVPRDSKGLSTPRNEKKMGQKICPATEVVFNDVFVPLHRVCRTKSRHADFAYTGIANVLGLTRAGVGAFATGVAENAYQTALAYTRSHTFMGEPMDQQQWVRIELAHLARRAQVARSTYLGSALSVCSFGITEPMSLIPDIPIANWLLNQPRITQLRHRVMASHSMNRIFKWAADRQTASNRDVVTAYADVAKVSCTDLALENCQRALSLMGKEGLRHENGAEKLLRDVKLLQIYEGTNQVNMLDFVKRHLVRQFH